MTNTEDNHKKNNSKVYHNISTGFVKLINLLLMTVPFVFAWYMVYADLLWVRFFMRGHWLVIGLYILLYRLIGRIYDAFRISHTSRGELIFSQAISLFEVNVLMYIAAWLLIRYVPPVVPFVLIYLIQIVLAVLWVFAAQAWYYHVFPAKKTIIIQDMRKGVSELIAKYGLNRKYDVTATVSIDECMKDISIIDDAETVFLVGVHSHDRNIIVKRCLMQDIDVFMIPRVGDLIVAGSKQRNMFHMLLMKVERYNPTVTYMVIKRLGDVVLSIIGLIVLSPVMIATAICIKAEDRGPVIYKQCRVTKDGRLFDMYKFRSMRTDAEKDGKAILSTGDSDDRVTHIGRYIRRFRIDELPQLVNIIKGDLSIVGPRAERPELAELYQKELPEFALRLQTRAGLTGYAQVYGKYNTTPYDKLLMDLMYIANASVFEDLKIMFATLKVFVYD